MKKNFKNKTIYKDLPCLCMGPKTIWDQTYQWTRRYLFLGQQSENLIIYFLKFYRKKNVTS